MNIFASSAEPVFRLNPLSPTGRIIGGAASTIEKVPYQVSIQAFSVHTCGGVIISSTFVLTAASCFIFPRGWYTVRSGSTLVSGGGTVTSDIDIVIHEQYITSASGIPSNDIALVKLNPALTFSTTQAPIALFTSGQVPAVGASAIITGWGTSAEGGLSPDVLHTVTVPILSKNDCNAAYSTWGGIPDGQICAGLPQGGVNSCEGDTGGPVTINGILAGIVSWSNGCARPGFPGVYTAVGTYRSWISANSGV